MSATTHWFACGCGRRFVRHTVEGMSPLKRSECPDCRALAPAMPAPVVAFSPAKPVNRPVGAALEKRSRRR